MSAFDVWVVRFEPGETPPAERLQKAFGLDAPRAAALERSLPRIVKHGVPAKTAGEMRQALEAIGAVVECKPARAPKAPEPDASQALFRAPDADLLAPGRVSAIDPTAPSADGSRARISVDEPKPGSTSPSDPDDLTHDSGRRIGASILAASRAQQRRIFIRRAVGTVLAGLVIFGVDAFVGNSIFRGEADWVGTFFDGVGIFFVGIGAYDLVTELRS
jgi:hypothetical protein